MNSRETRPPLQALSIRVALIAEPAASYLSQIREAEDVLELLRHDARTWDRERFVTLALDSGNRLLGIEEVSVGNLNSAPVHPREVFKGLILANAAAFIGVHNHPSGYATPSAEDVAITRKLRDAGELLGIPLLDHVVLGHDTFVSLLAEHGGLSGL